MRTSDNGLEGNKAERFKPQPYKMVKHTQEIRQQIAQELFERVWPFYGVCNFLLVLSDILSVLYSAIIIFIIIIIKTIAIIWRSWQDVQNTITRQLVFCICLPINKNQIIHKKNKLRKIWGIHFL